MLSHIAKTNDNVHFIEISSNDLFCSRFSYSVAFLKGVCFYLQLLSLSFVHGRQFLLQFFLMMNIERYKKVGKAIMIASRVWEVLFKSFMLKLPRLIPAPLNGDFLTFSFPFHTNRRETLLFYIHETSSVGSFIFL